MGCIKQIITSLTIGLLSISMFTACTSDKKKFENSITIAYGADVKALDPVFAEDYYASQVTSQIFETLFEYHYLKRPLKVQPLLAESMPEVSEDALTYTIKLKKGIYFQDNEAFKEGKGRELTAEDFIYSWKRLLDPANKSQGTWVFDGKVKGVSDWREKMRKGLADYDTPIEGFQATDKYTIQIKLEKPYHQLIYVLAMTYTAPTAKEVVDKYGEEIINHPVGTGPFILKDWIKSNKIVLVKNPNFRDMTYPTEKDEEDPESMLKDAGKKIPFVDKLVFNIITEDQTRWLNFMKGNLDILSIPKDNFDSSIANDQIVTDLADKGLELYVNTEPDLTYIAMNMKDPILGKNKKLRQAIALAYNTEAALKKFYNDRGIIAQSLIPPTIDGYDPSFKNEYKQYDIEKAKKLMVEAGYPNGKGLPEFEFSTSNSSTAVQMGEFFKDQMSQIGINIKIVPNSWPQFTQKIHDAKTQIWGIGWVSDYPDAENFLQLLYGENVSPGPNGSNFVNAEYDKLYKQALLLPSGEKRTKFYHKMRDIASEEMPIVPLVHRQGYYLTHGWIENFKRHITISDNFKYIRVNMEKKKKLKPEL